MKQNFSLIFITLGLCALAFGAFMGVLISMVYIDPDFMKSVLPFNQLRPLHTTSAVSWIILTAIGGLYFYITKIEKIKLFSNTLGKLHLYLFILVGFGIYYSLLTSNMGGREYLEYYPILTIPILVGWVFFGVNYFSSLVGKVKNWPVYYWMWGIGIVFMIYHLSEAHYWIFSDIRNDYIKDLSIQWKSYGSFVGSWNMLVYGTAIYVMSKIKDDSNVGRGKRSFFFFFLGLTNLMFGWAHHTYIIPTAPWIRYVAYVISMTEWIIFINIIYVWAKSLSTKEKKKNLLPYKFLIASEIWVFLNIVLALLMSIPTINYYTHGTHVTVAHSMGTTIGINTMILFASVSYIVKRLYGSKEAIKSKVIHYGFIVLNASLLIFWLVLIIGGIYKAVWMSNPANVVFGDLHEGSHSIFLVFIFFGCTMFVGLLMIIIPLINKIYPFCVIRTDNNVLE